MNEGLVRFRLVPVEVFGTSDCCEHGHNSNCESVGYGLSDAVFPWTDCNRAEGHMYRIDEPKFKREPGETIEVFVRVEDVGFFTKKFGTA